MPLSFTLLLTLHICIEYIYALEILKDMEIRHGFHVFRKGPMFKLKYISKVVVFGPHLAFVSSLNLYIFKNGSHFKKVYSKLVMQ